MIRFLAKNTVEAQVMAACRSQRQRWAPLTASPWAACPVCVHPAQGGPQRCSPATRDIPAVPVLVQVLDIQRRKLESGEAAGAGGGAAAAAATGSGAAGPSTAGNADGGDAQAVTALADVDAGMLLTVWEAIK